MLYFDWYNHSHFGSIRQQIWSILHFPLYLTLVLSVKGALQFIVWRKLTKVVSKLESSFLSAIDIWSADPSANFTTLQNSINATVWKY